MKPQKSLPEDAPALTVKEHTKKLIGEFLHGGNPPGVIEYQPDGSDSGIHKQYNLRHIGVYEFLAADPVPPPAQFIVTADGMIIRASNSKAIVSKLGIKPASEEEAVAAAKMLVEFIDKSEIVVTGPKTVADKTRNEEFTSFVPEDVRATLAAPTTRKTADGWEVTVVTFYSMKRPRMHGENAVKKRTLTFAPAGLKMAYEEIWSDRPGKLGL